MYRSLKNNKLSLGIVSTLFILTNGCEQNSSKDKSTQSINLGLVEEGAESQELTEEQQKEAERQALIAEVEEVEAKIKSRYSNLERERDRNQELKTNLLGKSARGCFADMKIESLEIIVDGVTIKQGKEINSNSKLSGEGSPTVFRYKLSPEISITNDESEHSLFSPKSGSLLKDDFKDYSVSSLEYLRIEKSGYSIDSKCTDDGMFRSCDYTNIEYDRFQLNTIKIVVNGETVYSKNLYNSHIFEKDKTLWADEQFQTNQAWLSAMKIDDCSQQQ